MFITNALLDIIVCPLTKNKLFYDKVNNRLVSVDAGIAYPVQDGIPILLIDKAIKLTEEEIEQFKVEAAK